MLYSPKSVASDDLHLHFASRASSSWGSTYHEAASPSWMNMMNTLPTLITDSSETVGGKFRCESKQYILIVFSIPLICRHQEIMQQVACSFLP
jgi:hypothetical protein